MSAPTAYNAQSVEVLTDWFGWSFGMATVVSFLVVAAVALGRKRENRPRIYRSTFCAVVASLGIIAVYSLRIPEYLEQTATVWDGTDVQAGYWDFAALGWAVLWLSAGFLSYAPSGDVLDAKKRGKSTDENGNPISGVAEKEDLSMKDNVNHWAPGHVLFSFGLNALIFGGIALQQAYPLSLWYLFPAGAIAILALIAYYIVVGYVVSSIPKKLKEASQAVDQKLYRSYIIFLVLFAIIAITMPVIAAGLSPTIATLQTTFALNTVIWMTISTYFSLCILLFAAMYYYDFVHAKGKTAKSKR